MSRFESHREKEKSLGNILDRLEHIERRLKNRIWQEGGCEAVEQIEDEIDEEPTDGD